MTCHSGTGRALFREFTRVNYISLAVPVICPNYQFELSLQLHANMSRKRPRGGRVVLLGAGEIKRLKARQNRRLTAARKQASFRAGFSRTSGFYGRYPPGGTELKFHDLDLDDALIASGGTITNSLNLIAQGTTESTRIGRKCNVRSIAWRFALELPEGTDDTKTSDVARVMLYLDKQANGATAAVTDILESADYQSFNNLANKSRFRTLMDRTYVLNSSAGGTSAASTDQWGAVTIDDTWFHKCNVPIEFDSTAGAITEIRSNNFGVLLISLSGNIKFDSKIRVRFSDG